MNTEEIEKEFEQIARQSQPLFKQPIKVSKEISPIGIYVGPTTAAKRPLLPLLDPSLDLISKMTRLLHAHDIVKENIYEYLKEKGVICVAVVIEVLRELSIIEDFKIILDKLNKLLDETYLYPESRTRLCVDNVEINTYNKNHPDTKFLIELNNIFQKIHSISTDVLSEYNILSRQYVGPKGIDITRILLFNIGDNVRIINIEPYDLPKNIIDFINAFTDEIKKSDYTGTYLNVLYVPIDKKYRLDLTLGAAFAHRSIIIYSSDPSDLYFEHIYADTNYSRTLAWKKYVVDFSEEASKAKIDILEEERKPQEKSLAWRYTLMKTRIEKEFLSDMAIIIYLINWDGIINHSIYEDIMEPEDEADIIYNYGLYAEYIEKEKRYTVKYNREIQNIIRNAIRDTVRGIENKLLPEG